MIKGAGSGKKNTWQQFNGQKPDEDDDEDTSHHIHRTPTIRNQTATTEKRKPWRCSRPEWQEFKIPQMSFECFARFVLYYYYDDDDDVEYYEEEALVGRTGQEKRKQVSGGTRHRQQRVA